MRIFIFAACLVPVVALAFDPSDPYAPYDRSNPKHDPFSQPRESIAEMLYNQRQREYLRQNPHLQDGHRGRLDPDAPPPWEIPENRFLESGQEPRPFIQRENLRLPPRD